MEEKFEMVAKTLKGLEAVLADELRGIGAEEVQPGRRMVAFVGDLEMLYKANLCCRTALRILKPFYKFEAKDADVLYEKVKEYDWSTLLSVDKTFCIDAVVNSEEFSHSRFVTYKVKDAIVDWFRDKYGSDKRPGVRLKDADIMINVHITDEIVTLSLDSSGESLHKRGYRVAQNEAPISEVLAAGIILMTGWKGETPFIDPMCGSGTFLIEAAMIAANINPGIYRKSFAFETWPDFDRELFEKLYNDDSNEREVTCKIIGADISPKAIEITRENLKSAGLAQYVSLEVKPISQWESAPGPGVVVTNPPYGERISAPDMEGLYSTIGSTMKNAFVDYHVWIIGYREEYFQCIGLAPSQKVALMNGALDCELREYVIFSGNKKAFLASGGKLKEDRPKADRPARRFDDEESPRIFRDRDGEEDGGFRKKRRFDDDDRRPRKFRDRDGEEDGGFRKKRRFDDDDRRPRKFRDRDGEDGDFRKKRRFDDDDRRPRKFRDRDDEDGDFRKKRRFDDDKPRKFRDRDGEDGDFRKKRRFDDDKPRKFRDRDDDRRDWSDREEEEYENPLAKRRNIRALSSIGKMPSLPPSAPMMRSRGWRKKGESNDSED